MTYIKYPRTPHFPWSPGQTSDDKVIEDHQMFDNKIVVVSEKIDGESTTMYSDHIHARSIDSGYHATRAWVKAFHGRIKHLIPSNWRIVGENVYGVHSIKYKDLDTYFYGIGVWDEDNVCLDWETTLDVFSSIGITPVPVLMWSIYDLSMITSAFNAIAKVREIEGYVVRNAGQFHYDAFGKNVAKYVRAGHVQTDEHWMHRQDIQSNRLKEGLSGMEKLDSSGK